MAANNGKYYTPSNVCEHALEVLDKLGLTDKIDLFIESSAGSGAFLDVLDSRGLKYVAYDIVPDDVKGRIIKADYLKTYIEYSRNNCHIGNPPFSLGGDSGKKGLIPLTGRFIKKYATECDYIAVVLPSSWFKKNILNDFTLVYTEILHNVDWVDCSRDGGDTCRVTCCLNVYVRCLSNSKTDLKFRNMKLYNFKRYYGNIEDKFGCDFYIRSSGCINVNPGGNEIGTLCKPGDFESVTGVKLYCSDAIKRYVIDDYSKRVHDIVCKYNKVKNNRLIQLTFNKIYEMFRFEYPCLLGPDELIDNDLHLQDCIIKE